MSGLLNPMVKDLGDPYISLESLKGIANRALLDPQHKFGNLYGCLNEEFLQDCFRYLKRDKAPGIDEAGSKHVSAEARCLGEPGAVVPHAGIWCATKAHG